MGLAGEEIADDQSAARFAGERGRGAGVQFTVGMTRRSEVQDREKNLESPQGREGPRKEVTQGCGS